MTTNERQFDVFARNVDRLNVPPHRKLAILFLLHCRFRGNVDHVCQRSRLTLSIYGIL